MGADMERRLDSAVARSGEADRRIESMSAKMSGTIEGLGLEAFVKRGKTEVEELKVALAPFLRVLSYRVVMLRWLFLVSKMLGIRRVRCTKCSQAL